MSSDMNHGETALRALLMHPAFYAYTEWRQVAEAALDEILSMKRECERLRAALAEKEAEVGRLKARELALYEGGEALRVFGLERVEEITDLTRRLEAMTAARDAEKARADAWQGEAMEYSDFGHGPSCELAKGGDGCNCPAALDAEVAEGEDGGEDHG